MSNTENEGAEGRWNLTLDGPRGRQPSVLVIERTGDTLTGSQSGSTGVSPISEIEIDGARVSWVNHVTSPLPIKIVFTGEVDGNNMTGNAKVGFLGTYQFTGVKE